MRPLSRSASFSAFLWLLVLPAAAQAPFLLQDVNPTSSSTPPSGLLAIVGHSPRDGEVIVMLDDGVHGVEPWRTDGTASGTSLLLDLTPGPQGTTLDPWSQPTSDARRLWFVVDAPGGQELWQTDGTTTGTSLFVTAAALGGFSITPPQVGKPVGDVAFFRVDGTLWRTNGQPSGTYSLAVPAADAVTVRSGVAWLTNGFGDVIASDGTTASLLFQVTAPDASPKLIECTDGQLVLRIPQYTGQTVTSTTLLWLDKPGAQPVTFPNDVHLDSLPGRLLVWTGAQLFAWDGSSAPSLLRQYLFVFGSWFRSVRAGSRCFFGAVDTVYGPEVWSTDGTAAGTIVLDSVPGPTQGTLGLTGYSVGDRALLRGTLAGSNGWLFASDGTLAGTTALGAAPGPLAAIDAIMVPIGHRRVALGVNFAGTGQELWIANGAAGTTTLVADVNPGAASSLPEFGSPNWVYQWDGVVAGSSLVWTADDGVHGFEPWSLPATGVRTLLRRYGERRFTVDDPVLGASLTFRAARLASGDLGVVGLGLPVPMPLPLGGGQFVHLDPTSAVGVAIVTASASGEWSGSLALPSSPALVGFRATTQPFFLAPNALGIEVGDAYWLTLGL